MAELARLKAEELQSMDTKDAQELARVKNEKNILEIVFNRVATDVLAGLSEFQDTPEEGYAKSPYLILCDIQRLGRERDTLRKREVAYQARLEVIESGLVRERDSLRKRVAELELQKENKEMSNERDRLQQQVFNEAKEVRRMNDLRLMAIAELQQELDSALKAGDEAMGMASMLLGTLTSIAKNTCCSACQEAAVVAQQTLSSAQPVADWLAARDAEVRDKIIGQVEDEIFLASSGGEGTAVLALVKELRAKAKEKTP